MPRYTTIACLLALLAWASPAMSQFDDFGGGGFDSFGGGFDDFNGFDDRRESDVSRRAAVTSPDDARVLTSKTVARMRRRLAARVTLEADAITIRDFARVLSDRSGVPVLIDRFSFDVAGVSLDETLAIHATDAPLRDVLQQAGADGITWDIRRDAVLLRPDADSIRPLCVRVFDVTDLAFRPSGPGRARFDVKKVVDDLKSAIDRPTWTAFGGEGLIRVRLLNERCLLIVTNRFGTLEKVEARLGAMRGLRYGENGARSSVPARAIPSCRRT